MVAIQRFEGCRELDFVGNVAASWSYTGRVGTCLARGCKFRCFGDSLVKFGVLPWVIKHQSSLKGYSLALHGGTAPASHFLLRHVLESGARPSAVVFDFAAGFLKDAPASKLRANRWAELLSLRESVEPTRAGRDPDFFARSTPGRLLTSFRSRFEAAPASWRRSGGRAPVSEITRSVVWNWQINAGGQANAIDPILPSCSDFPEPLRRWKADRHVLECPTMISGKFRYLLAAGFTLLFAVALWFRVSSLSAFPCHSGDEAYYGLQTARLLRGESFALRTPSQNLLNPYSIVLQSPFHLVARPSVWILRVPAVLCGVLAVALTYVLGTRRVDQTIALIAAALLAALPSAVYYSRVGLEQSQLPLFGILVIAFARCGAMGSACSCRSWPVCSPIRPMSF